MKYGFLIAFFMLGVAQVVSAQDVIVKKDGSTILSKVLEINTADVKYKKFSNQNGPTYTINKSDILAINYENGDKDTFENENNVNMSTSASSSGSNNQAAHFDESVNKKLIDESNNVSIGWTEAPKAGAGGTYHAFWRLKISDGSVLETNDIQLILSTPSISDEGSIVDTPIPSNGVFSVTVKNKTSRTIFLDLGNSFFIRNNDAQAYYVPSKTTNYVGGSTGTGVNMGAVTGALGVGGTIGTLANGVNVSRTNTSGTSTEIFSQRVIAVPPMSSKSLDPQLFVSKDFRLSKLFHYVEYADRKSISRNLCTLVKDFDRGDMVHFNQQDSPFHLSFFLSYAFDETCTSESTVKVDMYASDLYMLAINLFNNNIKFFSDSWRNTLHFFTNTPMPGRGLKKKSLTLDQLGGVLEHAARDK